MYSVHVVRGLEFTIDSPILAYVVTLFDSRTDRIARRET
jgi:uncharacterized FlaG/YvyC family protein